MSDEIVRWPRVQQLLFDIMQDTPQELAEDEAMGLQFIEPGVPASETALIVSLRRGFGSIPKMPMGGPFLKEEEIQEIERWIDAGMPE